MGALAVELAVEDRQALIGTHLRMATRMATRKTVSCNGGCCLRFTCLHFYFDLAAAHCRGLYIFALRYKMAWCSNLRKASSKKARDAKLVYTLMSLYVYMYVMALYLGVCWDVGK
ncbi:hypothetical protein C5167_043111 [Papaver somniferum]|uniref:Uncharacterized protein n=1 Tax=Papaver somniferum TaxID=3469 RepID=A0A4Y7L7E7_PAPSO|nr:hypothetical protein C5167_043111 [Papaver somniferum]